MTKKEQHILEKYLKLEKEFEEARRYNDTDEAAAKIFIKLVRLKPKAMEIKERLAL